MKPVVSKSSPGQPSSKKQKPLGTVNNNTIEANYQFQVVSKVQQSSLTPSQINKKHPPFKENQKFQKQQPQQHTSGYKENSEPTPLLAQAALPYSTMMTKFSQSHFFPEAGQSPRHYSMDGGEAATLTTSSGNLVASQQARQTAGVPFKKNKRGGLTPQDDELVMQDRSNNLTAGYTHTSRDAISHGSPVHQASGVVIQHNFGKQPFQSKPSSQFGGQMPGQPKFSSLSNNKGIKNQLEHSIISSVSQSGASSIGASDSRQNEISILTKLLHQTQMQKVQQTQQIQLRLNELNMQNKLQETQIQQTPIVQEICPNQFSAQHLDVETIDTTQDSIDSRSIGCNQQLFVKESLGDICGPIRNKKVQPQDHLQVTLMNSSTTQESSQQSSLYSSILSPPRDSNNISQNVQPIQSSQQVHDYHQQQARFDTQSNQQYGVSTDQQKPQKNVLLQDQNFLNYLNKTQLQKLHQPTSRTPNPKLFQQNRSDIKREKPASRKGQNFVGLQSYIISEIDSGSDNKVESPEKNFLSDVSSFANSDQNDSQQNSSQSDAAEEHKDVMMGGMQSNLPSQTKQAINQIWQQTPMIKEQPTQNGFITDSPFSFKNPIFFSVPRDNGSKKIKLLQSKRQLFGNKAGPQKNVESKPPLMPFKQSKMQPLSNMPPPTMDDQTNQFASFVQAQASQANKISGQVSSQQNQNNLFSLLAKQGNAGNQVQSNIFNKHNNLFGQSETASTKQSKPMVNRGLFSPKPGMESSTIVEENSCSDNLSNLGQGPSPMKQGKQMQQPLANMVANFQTVLKTMTPMPKLSHTFSLPQPSRQQCGPDFEPINQNSLKQNQMMTEFQSRERVQRLKQDLTETPNSKYKYKQISRDMKEHEKGGFSSVVKETFSRILSIPRKVHWRVVLDLADYAKRESRFKEAKLLFKLVSYLQPFAYQGWLEYAKMEEECGNQEKSQKILLQGLKFSSLNENLFIKAIKVEEKLGNIEAVRSLVDELSEVPIDKCWRMLLEGALFEGRIGNKQAAREKFRTLMNKCQSYGPVFLEASRYEERESYLSESLALCEEGLDFNPKYGPLWFQYLRLYEKLDEKIRQEKFESLQTIFNEMFQNVPKELDWKIYIEVAQTYDRLGEYEKAICYLGNSVQSCPDNIKWKIWLIAARIQFRLGEYERAREIIERCCYEVPSKQMSMAMLEYAKHFEMRGQPMRARQIMQHTKRIAKTEWKTHFEAVLLEIRSGCFDTAEELVHQSLNVHFATGRLWATLIQLQHARSHTEEEYDGAFRTFNQALREIPKSGEVWCEGARICMANSAKNRACDFSQAETYLNFAIQFTPQYGDSFLEMLKLYLLTDQHDKIALLKQQCIHAEPNYGVLWFFYKDSYLDNAIEVWDKAIKTIKAELEAQKSNPEIERWMASSALITQLRNGLKDSPFETRIKIIYGFEQVLPQVAFA